MTKTLKAPLSVRIDPGVKAAAMALCSRPGVYLSGLIESGLVREIARIHRADRKLQRERARLADSLVAAALRTSTTEEASDEGTS